MDRASVRLAPGVRKSADLRSPTARPGVDLMVGEVDAVLAVSSPTGGCGVAVWEAFVSGLTFEGARAPEAEF